MARAFWVRWVAAGILVATSLGGIADAQQIPENIRKLVFVDHLHFSDPVEAAILVSDLSRGGGSDIEDTLWGGGFLIPEGYLQKMRGAPPQSYDYYVVTQRLQPHMRIEKAWPSDWIKIRVAKRALGTIDYVNQRTLTLPMSGEGAPAWSFTFTYTLEPTLANLPRLGPFKGKATVVRDPSDGQWKIMDASLDECSSTNLFDRTTSTCAYDSLLKQWREAAIRKRTSQVSMTNVKYEYEKKEDGRLQGIRFTFDVFGGKPPYFLGGAINGRSLADVQEKSFNRYIGRSTTLKFPLYEVTQDVAQSRSDGGSGYLRIAMHHWGSEVFEFGWPPDLTLPLRVGLTVQDSSSPPLRASFEVMVDKGASLALPRSPIRQNQGGMDSIWWIQEAGRSDEPPPAFDLSGVWRGKSTYIDYASSRVLEGPMEIVFEQKGSAVQGTGTMQIEGRARRVTVSGTVKGTQLALEGRWDGSSSPFRVSGGLPYDGMSIDASWSLSISGRWQLRRASAQPPAMPEITIRGLAGTWAGSGTRGTTDYTFTWIVNEDGSYQSISRIPSGQVGQNTGSISLQGGQLRFVNQLGVRGTLTVQEENGLRVIRGTFDGRSDTFVARQVR